MISKFLSSLDFRHWLLTHLVWIIALAVGFYGFTQWRYEHDNSAAKAAQLQVAQANIANLQAQIVANDNQAAQKVQVITRIVHDAQTPAQVVAAIPTLTDIPLNARTIPNDPVDVEVAAVPLIDLIGRFAADETNLTACRSDLTAEKAIVVQQQTEIIILKRKPPLKQRLIHAAKVGGTILGIGILIGLHF